MAIVFACERFHQYIFAKACNIETDHKPFDAIFKKQLIKVPPRIQRPIMRMQPYDVYVKYRKGTEMYVADALSRAYLEDE